MTQNSWKVMYAYLFPKFARLVKLGPKTGSSASLSSLMREKSLFRFCSICCRKRQVRILQIMVNRALTNAVTLFSVIFNVWKLIANVDRCITTSGSCFQSLQMQQQSRKMNASAMTKITGLNRYQPPLPLGIMVPSFTPMLSISDLTCSSQFKIVQKFD